MNSLKLAAFVIAANIIQAVLMIISTSEAMVFCLLMASCLAFTALLSAPSSATTGHKLLVLTFAAGTIWSAVASVSTAWAPIFDTAWLAYSFMHDNFAITMQVFTALEIIAVFSGLITQLGAAGGYFQRCIDNLYSAVFLRSLRAIRISGV